MNIFAFLCSFIFMCLLEFFVSSLIGLFEGVKTRVRVDSEWSDEFEVKVGMQKVSLLSPFLQLWQMMLMNWHERVCLVSCCMLTIKSG